MNSVYIAVSIDGYIADENHSIAWLDHFNQIIEKNKDGYFFSKYNDYYQSIDNVVMGAKTFEIINSFGTDYPYLDKPNYILTRKKKDNYDNINFITLDDFIKMSGSTKNWFVGGGLIISALLELNLIDEIILTVMPIVLGKGVPLFTTKTQVDLIFDLTSFRSEDSILELVYTKKNAL